jgi:hypothetical protein
MSYSTLETDIQTACKQPADNLQATRYQDADNLQAQGVGVHQISGGFRL